MDGEEKSGMHMTWPTWAPQLISSIICIESLLSTLGLEHLQPQETLGDGTIFYGSTFQKSPAQIQGCSHPLQVYPVYF